LVAVTPIPDSAVISFLSAICEAVGGFEEEKQQEPVPVAVEPLPRVKYSEFAQLLAASREGIKSGE
jgi:hypothetical protein